MDGSKFSAISYRRAYFFLLTSRTTVKVFASDGSQVIATYSSLKDLFNGKTEGVQLYKKKKYKKQKK